MKLKKLLSFALALAMVLAFIPALSLTASADSETVNATAFGHSGSASGTGVFIGTGSITTSTSGSSTGAPCISGTTSSTTGGPLGSSRIGYISFTITVPEEGYSFTDVTLNLYALSVNGNLGSNWMKLAAYRTTGTPSSVSIGGMTDTEYPAVDDDYSYDAAYWTNEQISSSNLGWKTIDVTEAANDAVAGLDAGDEVTLAFRLQVPTAGTNIAYTDSEYPPYLSVTTQASADISITYQSASGVELATATDTAYVDDTYQVTTTVNDNYLIIEKDGASDGVYGYIAEIVDSPSITVEESDNAVTVIVNPIYEIISEGNLIPDGEDIDNWTLGGGSLLSSSSSITKSTANVHSGDYSAYTYVSWSNSATDGWGGDHSIAFRADVNANSKYYFAISVYFNTTEGTEMTIGTLSTAGDNSTLQGSDGSTTLTNGGITSSSDPTTTDAGLGKLYANCSEQWNQLSYAVTTDDDSKEFLAAFYYLCDAKASYFDDSMLYEVADYVEDASYTVTRNYYIDTVAEENLVYTETQKGISNYTNATFDDYYYTVDGMNTLYYTAGETYTEAATDDIVLEALPNNGSYADGDIITVDGSFYTVESDNLIPNGDFTYGMNGWYDGTGVTPTEFTVNGDGTVTSNDVSGGSSAYALHRSWQITPGSTYLFLMDSESETTSGNTTTLYLSSSAGTAYETAEDSTVLVGVTNSGKTEGTISSIWEAGTNEIIFTAGDTDAYASIWFRWIGTAYGNFGLYEINPINLGVSVFNGAQIRVGSGAENEELLGNSGLRFIAVVDTENTLAVVTDAVVGIAISADDTFDATADTLVPATTYQDEDETIFTVAITGIAESNYNTVYYAIPYVKIGTEYYTGTAVARTPYQVAAGILVNSTDSEGYSQSTSDTNKLYDVLNVYVNKTGARITLASGTEDTYVVEIDDYANDATAFFEVTSAKTDSDSGDFVIVLTRLGNAEFYSYADDQYRVNNSHDDFITVLGATAKVSTDGTTLTITIPAE